MEQRNKMSLRQAIQSRGNLDFFDGVVDSQGVRHTFFTLNGEPGYVSPRALRTIHAKTLRGAVDELQYCECRKEGEEAWIPVIMVKGGLTATATLGASDL